MASEVTRTTLHLVGPREPESVSDMRHTVLELARPRVTRDQLEDVALVTSELLTNALQHGASDSDIVADVFESDDRFVVAVTNETDGGQPPPVSEWSMAGGHRVRGRGLAIVRQLAPEVATTADDDTVVVTVSWPRVG